MQEDKKFTVYKTRSARRCRDAVFFEDSSQQNNDIQNRLIKKLSSGNLIEAQYIEMEGASLVEPDINGITPLKAAIHGINLEAVMYIDQKLGDKAKDEWAKIDLKEERKTIERSLLLNPLFTSDGEEGSITSLRMSNIGFFRRAPECRDENEKSILLMKVIPETQNTIEQDVKIERREEIKKLIEYIESKACVNIIYKF